MFGSDTVTSVAGRASGTNAGVYADNLSGATGSGLGNYAISYANGSLTILTPKVFDLNGTYAANRTAANSNGQFQGAVSTAPCASQSCSAPSDATLLMNSPGAAGPLSRFVSLTESVRGPLDPRKGCRLSTTFRKCNEQFNSVSMPLEPELELPGPADRGAIRR